MLPAEISLPGAGLAKDQRRLLGLYKKLSSQDRESLLAFAEFLLARDMPAAAAAEPVAEPRPIPRSEDETVVAAMKRLSESYHMIEKDTVLHESAALMGAHVMQGRPAEDVIDELEALFEQTYQRLVKGSKGKD